MSTPSAGPNTTHDLERIGPFYFKKQEKTNEKNWVSEQQKNRIREILIEAKDSELQEVMQCISDVFFERSDLSLRAIEWGIFNYAKSHGSQIINKKSWRITQVHKAYLEWRRNYKRKIFDCYRRTGHLYFRDQSTGKEVTTTAAQINFFWFLYSESFLEFLKENIARIRQHSREIHRKRKIDRLKTLTAGPTGDAPAKKICKRQLLTGIAPSSCVFCTGIQKLIEI